jgi:hypothetical protein
MAAIAAMAACSSSSKEPPIVPSGTSMPFSVSEGPTHPDGGSNEGGEVVTKDGAVDARRGATTTLTCTYLLSTGIVCAVLDVLPPTDVDASATACAGAGFDGEPGTTCDPDSLVGCCIYSRRPSTSFSAPNAVCYYPGDIGNQETCLTSGGTWSTSIP